jgi:hypothetical protein
MIIKKVGITDSSNAMKKMIILFVENLIINVIIRINVVKEKFFLWVLVCITLDLAIIIRIDIQIDREIKELLQESIADMVYRMLIFKLIIL